MGKYNPDVYRRHRQTLKGKQSHRRAQKVYRTRHPERIRKMNLQHMGKRARFRVWAIGVLKLAFGGCTDCGFNRHPDALDFDHRPGEEKTALISRLFTCSWRKLLTEMYKCDVVCANCHRIRTSNRRKDNDYAF